MQIEIQIKRDSDDLAQDRHLTTAYNMSGVPELPMQETERNPTHHPYRKAFNRLRGRIAALSDYELAHEGVVTLVRKTQQDCVSMEVFSDEKLNETWRDAAIMNAHLALREWGSFLECSRDDVQENCDAPEFLVAACVGRFDEMIASLEVLTTPPVLRRTMV